MNVHEKNLFALAERLSTPVYELKANMPIDEYFKWIEFFNEKQESSSNNLLSSPEKMLAGVMGHRG
jgi:hypothetical protein